MTGCERAVVIAATSSLGKALCHRLAEQGWGLALCGGDEDALARLANDIAIRYRVPVEWMVTAFNAEQRDDTFSYDQMAEQTDGCSAVFILSDDAVVDNNDVSESLARATKRYYTVPATLLSVFATRMAANGKGALVLVSSLTNERGRFDDAHYNCAREALMRYTHALQEQCAKEPVSVTAVSLGLVDTPLMYGVKLPLGLERRLVLSRERAAARLVRMMRQGATRRYLPAHTRMLRRLRHWVIRPLPLWEQLAAAQKPSDVSGSDHQPWLPGLTPQGRVSADASYYASPHAPSAPKERQDVAATREPA